MSNLLEKASIVTTPTAYENGKILSVKPAPSLGSELVVNGGFDTDSNWTKSANWTIANGKATSTGAGRMFQSIPFLETNIGTTVEVSFDITELTANSVVVNCYGGISESFTTVGTHTFTITTTNNTNLYFNNAGAGNLIGSIDNVSVKQVIDGDFDFTRNSSATRVNSQGLIEDVQILSSNLVSNGDFSQEGSELITNGDFATDSDWNKDDSWSINNDTANYNYISGRNMNSSTASLVVGKTYKLVYTLLDYVSGSVENSSAETQIQRNSNGTYTEYFIARFTFLRFRGSSGGEFSIDNVSVKEVGQGWSTASNWTISNGSANADGSSSGLLSQTTIPTVVGKTYKVEYTILNYVSGSLRFGYGGTSESFNTSNGTYTSYRVATNTNSVFASSSISFIGSITNISIIEITEDTNLPRIDYTGGVGHWLFEPQSTNLIPNANQYTGNTVYYTVTPNQSSPDGENNATLFVEKTSTSPYSVNSINASIIGGQTYTYSFFIKYAGKQNIPVNATDGVSGFNANIDILNGTVNSGTAEVKDFGNGWFRVLMTRTVNASASNGSIQLNFGNQTGDGTSGFYLFGYQLEQSSFATSYIPTSGSTVTRLQDAAFGAGSSDLINSTEGVLYGEIAVLEGQTNINRYITINDGTDDNIVSIHFRNNALNQIRAIVKVGNSNQCDINYNAAGSTSFAKFALKWKVNDFAFWVNGVKIGDDLSGITFNANTLNKLSFDSGQGSDDFFGKTKCLAVFKEALTDAELTCLTTI